MSNLGYPAVKPTLELLLRDVHGLLHERLLSLMLYGSIVEHDFSPGYGDLDFLAIVEGDLAVDDCVELRELRKQLRSGRWGQFAHMLEGAFLPRAMLNPQNQGQAYWWGTSGERTWSSNRLGAFCLQHIRALGLPIYGLDLRSEIPLPSPSELRVEAARACADIGRYGVGGDIMSVDWLFLAARVLHWAKTGNTCSKSEAAQWAYANATGEWRLMLPRAAHLRKHPKLATESTTHIWLSNLGCAILSAGEEAHKAVEAMND